MSNRLNAVNFKSVNWAKLENLLENLDNFKKIPIKDKNTKAKAFDHLSNLIDKVGLTRTVKRQVVAKTKKIKNSAKKDERKLGSTITKEINWHLYNNV
jgi:ribosome assembly protein YihI (activator of Der GTPase)